MVRGPFGWLVWKGIEFWLSADTRKAERQVACTWLPDWVRRLKGRYGRSPACGDRRLVGRSDFRGST